MSTQLGFRFDYGRCVGCQACVIACAVENDLPPAHTWRTVYSYDQPQIPVTESFHLTLSCNHCRQAPCVQQCPTLALKKDRQSGLVQVDDASCIGCHFCSWVCPYDAPKFIPGSGVMSKCTACNHRLADDLPPACVSICPVDALGLEPMPAELLQSDLPGLPPTKARPSLDLKNTRPTTAYVSQLFDEDTVARFAGAQKKPATKISLRGEWPLLVFTLVLAFSCALFTSAFTGAVGWSLRYSVLAGWAAGLLSLLHLGKPLRAWRAGLNVLRSWLSREIVFFSLFLLMATASIWKPQYPLFALSALAAVLPALVSADMVYRVAARQTRWAAHSAELWAVFLTAFSLLNGFYYLLLGTVLVRLALYAGRRHRFKRRGVMIGWMLLRIALLLSAAVGAQTNMIAVGFILLAAGDVMDRIEFYKELEIITPAIHQQQAMAAGR